MIIGSIYLLEVGYCIPPPVPSLRLNQLALHGGSIFFLIFKL